MFCASIPSYLAAVDGVRWSSEGCGDIGGGVLGDGVGGEGESPCMYFDGRVGGSKESSAKSRPLPSAVEVSDLR